MNFEKNNGQYGFRTTQWTLVLSARDNLSGEADKALERLCQTYWYPLYSFARYKGSSPDDAQDRVQGFFEKLLSRNYLRSVNREKGKFRTFLLTAFSGFLANEWDKRNRLKRGGDRQIISFDGDCAEDRFKRELVDPAITPDAAYDRAWAQTVFDRVISKLREEQKKLGEERRFDALNFCLMGGDAEEGYAQIGADLGLSEGGVKTAVRRIRLRFRDLLREELAQTLAPGSDVDQEIREMITALK